MEVWVVYGGASEELVVCGCGGGDVGLIMPTLT